MATVEFGSALTLTELEHQLSEHKLYIDAERGWSQAAAPVLGLDLSSVEYADFVALAQIALLIEGAARRGLPVWLATPLRSLSAYERRCLDSFDKDPARARHDTSDILARTARRKHAYAFMSRCGFIDAIRPRHVPNINELVNVIPDHDDSESAAAQGTALSSQHVVDEWSDGLRDIVPLRWLPYDVPNAATAWENEIAKILALRAPVLTTDDVDAVVTIVLRELVDNVASHSREHAPKLSCSPAALLGGIAIVGSQGAVSPIGDRTVLHRYTSWLNERHATVIRLIVGDSGRGICSTLAPPPSTARNLDLPDLGRQLRRSERSLLWSMSPWSSHGHLGAGEQPRVRGLASVRRVVRESAGAIILRSGDAVSGMTYPDGTRKAVSEAGLAYIPGTLIEIDLAPRMLAYVSSPEPFGNGRRPKVAMVTEPRWSQGGSLDKGYLLRALRLGAKNGSEDESNILCVISDIPDGEGASASFFFDLLQLAEEVAEGQSLVVALCLGQSAIEIEPRIRSFDDGRLRSGEVAGVPVMILDRQGKIRWLGVDKRQSAILSALARVPTGVIAVKDVANLVNTSQAAVSDSLRRLSNWVGFDHDGAWLRYPSDTVDEAITQKILRKVRARVGARRRSTAAELYATPTLAIIDRPEAEQQVFSDLGGDLLAGYVLGRHTRRMLKAQLVDVESIENLSVACIGQFPSRSIGSFRAALGSNGSSIMFSGETGLYDDPEIPFIRVGGRYILLTSALITAERLNHAANDLVRAGAEPIGIACISDRRAVPESLTILGRPLNVLSLVRSRITVDGDNSPAQYIDPVWIPPGSRSLPDEIQYPIRRETVLAWCETTPGALLTGHIARHSRRHFYSFLDPGPLLARSSVRESISNVSKHLIDDWLTKLSMETEVTGAAIFYIDDSDSVACDLAQLIADTVGNSTGTLGLRGVYGLRHAPVSGRFVVLPPDIDLPPGTAVLVVDWGSVTLHTIQGLITAAGHAGAAAILALVLTSQLDRLEELTARGIRAVAGRCPVRDDGQGARDNLETDAVLEERALQTIPARIEFMSSFPVGYSSVWECIPCRYSREYLEESRKVSSELLQAHAEALAECLEPRDLARYRRDGPRDALGTPLSPHEVVQLMRMRGLLDDARMSTAARIEMRETISNMSVSDLDAFVRLLTIEPRLLKRAPMRHKKMRQALQSKLISRLRNAISDSMEIELRRQYLITLRVIDKKDYVVHFMERIVESIRQREDISVAFDLLLGIQTLVSRTYHRSLPDAEVAERALAGALDKIRSDPLLMRERETLSVVATLSELLARTRYTSLTSASKPSAQDAWASLRQNYYTPIIEHIVDARTSAVQVAVQLDRERSSEMWQKTLLAWQTTQDFLTSRVLPLLPSIKDIVLARMYEQGSAEDVERWRRACTREVLDELQKVTSLLIRFVDNPAFALDRKDEARRLVGWWHRVFFAKPSRGLESAGRSLLAAFSDCPCTLEETVDEAVSRGIEIAESMQRHMLKPEVIAEGSHEVFCNRRLIVAIIQQLFENALDWRHSADSAKLAPISIRIDVSESEHELQVRMLNDGTQAREPVGNGITSFDRYVRNYGGSLTGGPINDGSRWTYEASLRLQKYEPVYVVADDWSSR